MILHKHAKHNVRLSRGITSCPPCKWLITMAWGQNHCLLTNSPNACQDWRRNAESSSVCKKSYWIAHIEENRHPSHPDHIAFSTHFYQTHKHMHTKTHNLWWKKKEGTEVKLCQAWSCQETHNTHVSSGILIIHNKNTHAQHSHI